MKASSAIVGANDTVMLPRGSTHTDWEVELGVVIGKPCKYVSVEEALDYVAGYFVSNDVSERHYQTQLTGQWTKGKSCDTFGPIGPWLVTADEVPDPQNLNLGLNVNGKVMQNGHTSKMIFTVAECISHLSQLSPCIRRCDFNRNTARCWHGDKARACISKRRRCDGCLD